MAGAHTFVMCLKLGQGVHSHLAQSTVEQPLGFFLFFFATPRQGSWGWSPPFTLCYTPAGLWNTGRGWGARLFLWGLWGWTQSILHGNCWGRNTGVTADGSWRSHFLWTPTPFPGGQGPRSPHPVTTCMFSCPEPQPDMVQLPWLGVSFQCLAHSPKEEKSQGGQVPLAYLEVDASILASQGERHVRRICPTLTWPASGPGLPARPSPFPTVLPSTHGGPLKSCRKGQNQDEEGRDGCRHSRGKQKQRNQRGKKRGCRLLYNSWPD